MIVGGVVGGVVSIAAGVAVESAESLRGGGVGYASKRRSLGG
jgi:hypothetical protein